MNVVMHDGEETEYGPGDFASMAPATTPGPSVTTTATSSDWQGYADYANRTT